jgi:hypothetical protein
MGRDKQPERPHDPKRLAKSILGIATGEVEEPGPSAAGTREEPNLRRLWVGKAGRLGREIVSTSEGIAAHKRGGQKVH